VAPDAAPPWLKPLIDHADRVPTAYRRRVPPDVFAALTAAKTAATPRDAAVLVLFSGPADAVGSPPDDVDLLVTVRASTLRHHAGQAAFPGGATDPGDDGPVHTAFREATEETGLDTGRIRALATLPRMFIPPSGFHVVPVLAHSPDPGPVGVVDESETAATPIHAGGPVRRSCSTRCWCGASPARSSPRCSTSPAGRRRGTPTTSGRSTRQWRSSGPGAATVNTNNDTVAVA
jgi:8-oxo-dGTP pyrophosphatase MutT (NUDIX family)